MALWTGLGQVATVAQLTGVDASGLISMILEAVRTVSRNREECRHLARRVMMIGDLLQKLQGWDMMQDPEIRRPLDGLDDTLREAYMVISSCRDCSAMYRFLMGWKQAEQFREVQQKIDSYLQLYPFISHIDITRRLDKLCNSANASCSQIQAAGEILGPSTTHSNPDSRTVGDGSGLEHTESQSIQEAARRYLGEEHQQSGYWEHNGIQSIRKNRFTWCCWWLQDMTRPPYISRFIDQGIGFPVFRLSDRKAATNNFSSENLIGCGGFGTVYKGQLRGGLKVAIKRCFSSGSSSDRKQLSRQFEAEIKVLLKLQHINIVKLLGYCIERGERILVYEYVPNGCLGQFIFGTGTGIPPDWSLRFRIIIGMAQGIVYLHEYCGVTILHRDLKPSNVLLDSRMNPKIIDFGIARILGSTTNEDGIRGTLGYVDPEYIMLGRCSCKTDVYSFGVILLEIITVMRCISPFPEGPSHAGLVDYAWEMWTAGRSLELIDPSLHDEPQMAEILRCIQIALLCVEPRPEDRPTMPDAILMLSSGTVSVPSPKRRGYEEAQVAPSFSTEQTDLPGF
ncbi:cysteine-rich receptor-like protein kinase 19 isoform X2 [Phragmites australis]|uniref:cysteine-rich receptor-like protein kinase 19 isoform X2 n=1 Tax=Phragmites australis TaxID=29695 RepID=UPI002D787C49|nr:cysteine-rich receptor-like protein kinase 19 isoform X2 [Phragmites australis]